MGAGFSALWAQSGRSIIFGTVTDPTGAIVSTADITVTNVATGITESAKPDESGNYVIADLPAATYNVTCKAVGFQTVERTGVLLQVDQARPGRPADAGWANPAGGRSAGERNQF